MSRRRRLRNLSTDELCDMIAVALVEMALPDLADPDSPVKDLDRAHRELVTRHRRERLMGCTCQVCFDGFASALEA